MKFCDLRNAAKPFHTADAFGVPHGAEGIEGAQHREDASRRGSLRSGSARQTLTSLVAHGHARLIASGSTDRSSPVKLWDLEGNCFGSPAPGSKNGGGSKKMSGFGAPRCMAFHPNLVALAAGGADGVATVWQSENGGSRARYEP